ncbi:Phosphatidylinositol 4-kinase gamma 1 [Hibiscus syriacus]|uniref:1-phosphatidylinositol 4-kinase n=1 Tax=Hibiscus syriacus TaxID=106335 RepID=A0A6A3BA32_HIBSY|nr:phosphatidylinositol 4-kinase gamma 1-like [Hibiscus syriacus]XP_038990806.1 phosphatidylinositol 4-kinase gamma 1-like [Hibiscus syriacus]KAE8713243.1 Phosphatidylinositol 4-kinase gamma 1 [Hibiscus syriacus]
MAVVVDRHHGFKPFSRSQRCKLQSFTQLEYNILEHGHKDLAHSLKFLHRSFSTPCLSFATNVKEEFDTHHPRVEIIRGQRAPRISALVVEVAMAMASGEVPIPASNGLGGAYFLHNRSGETIAVVKPIDEEPLGSNNLNGCAGSMLGQPGTQRTIRVDETGIRELAAYLLDHDEFAGVPATALVKISHVAFHVNEATAISATPYKIASIQNFVSHDFDAGELGPAGFSVASVHRIGIFDLRILNLDRHAGNILVKKKDQRKNYAAGAAELVPIDHGLCLPEFLDDPYFEWLHWPQALVPFSDSETKYILNLNPNKDAELLRTELPSLRESSIRVMILCTVFLKQAASAGLCLADIGAMVTREIRGGEERPSMIEAICTKAKTNVFIKTSEVEDDIDNSYDKFEVDTGIFLFDNEIEDIFNEVADLPKLFRRPLNLAKSPKPLELLTTRSMPALRGVASLNDNYNSRFNTEYSAGNTYSYNDSMSFVVQKNNHENGGTYLGDMSEAEWEMFLKCFEKLLPQAFEDSNKLKLGTSCNF